MINLTIPRAALEKIVSYSKNMTSKDETRYLLTVVCIDAHNDRLRLRATDGYKMIEESFDCSWLVESLKANSAALLCYKPQVKMLEILLKNNKGIREFNAAFDDGPKNLRVYIGNESVVFAEVDNQNTYPYTDAIKPKEPESKIEIRLNAEYLLALAKAARRADDKKCTFDVLLTINTENKLAPIVVTKGDAYGILMPMRN